MRAPFRIPPPAAGRPTDRRFSDRLPRALAGLFTGLLVASVATAEDVIVAEDAAIIVDGTGPAQLPFTIRRHGESGDGIRLEVETAPGGANPAVPGAHYDPIAAGTEVILEPGSEDLDVNVDVHGDQIPPDSTHTLLLQVTTAQAFSDQPRLLPAAKHSRVCCLTRDMVLVDLNDNGNLDLVTGNDFSWDISVLRNTGNGDFVNIGDYGVNNPQLGAFNVAAGDLSGNGHPDVVVAGFWSGEILRYPGDGSGNLGAPETLSIGDGEFPSDVIIGDVDGDDHLDIVTINGDSTNLSVLRNDGSGGFDQVENFPTGGGFGNGVALADVDGDGQADLVTANTESSDLSVLINDGEGDFGTPQLYSAGMEASPLSVTVGDVTGDGLPDIVTANQFDDGSPFPPAEATGSVSVLAGDGLGGFSDAVVIAAGVFPGRVQAVAIGDVTGDDNADIVYTQPNGNRAGLLAGDGSGGFADPLSLPVSVGPNPIAIGDVTGDGIVDVVTANGVGESISVLPGDGAGNVGFPGHFDAGVFPDSIVVSDFDGDGRPDVATANMEGNEVSVLLGDGAGGFAPAVNYPVDDSPTWVIAHDLDDDGHPDLATANLAGSTVSVLWGDGSGSFTGPDNLPLGAGNQGPRAVAAADINEDGHADLVTVNEPPLMPGPADESAPHQVGRVQREESGAPTGDFENDTVSVLLGDGEGGFAEAMVTDLGTGSLGVNSLVVVDATGNGHVDVVTANFSSANLSLLEGDGSGGLADVEHIATGEGVAIVEFADVTVDGHADLITLNHTDQSVSVHAGDGAGNYDAPVHHPIFAPDGDPCGINPGPCPWPWDMHIADVNGDGHPDIITANTDNDAVSVLVNDGAGDFSTVVEFQTGAHPAGVGLGDITGDGNPDVITANRNNDNISVLPSDLAHVVLADSEALGTIVPEDGDPLPLLVATPSTVAFGTVPVGTVAGPVSVTLENAGTGEVQISTIQEPFVPFAHTGGSCQAPPFDLAPGESCTLEYNFEPLEEIPYSESLEIESDADPLTIELTGSGDDGGGGLGPVVDVDLALDFDTLPPGASDTRDLVVTNSGDAELNVLDIMEPAPPFALADSTRGDACPAPPFVLAPAEACAIGVIYAPEAPGDHESQLGIVSNAPSSPDFVQLAGSAQGDGPVDPAHVIPAIGPVGLVLLALLMLAGGLLAQQRSRVGKP